MPARFAQHLVERGLVPAPTADEALRRRESTGGALDTALLESGAMSENALLSALAELTSLQTIDLANFQPNPEMARFIPANVADRLCAVPLTIEDKTLHVACAYPPPARALEEVAVLLGKKLQLWIALEMRIRDWIATVYGAALSQRFSKLVLGNRGTRAPASEAKGPPGLARASDPRPTPESKSTPVAAAIPTAPLPAVAPAAPSSARPSIAPAASTTPAPMAPAAAASRPSVPFS